jgi:hypothetical protein
MVIEADLVKDATENSVESGGKKFRFKFRFKVRSKYGLARIFLSSLICHSVLLSLSDVVNYAFCHMLFYLLLSLKLNLIQVVKTLGN